MASVRKIHGFDIFKDRTAAVNTKKSEQRTTESERYGGRRWGIKSSRGDDSHLPKTKNSRRPQPVGKKNELQFVSYKMAQ